MKIGLFADPHYCNKEYISNRRPTLSYNKIKEAMECFKAQNVDLAICLGDLVDDCGSDEENIKAIKHLCEMIYSYGILFYSLMGNHDCENFTSAEFDAYSCGACPPFTYETEKSILIFLDCNYKDDESKYVPHNVDWTNTFLPQNQLDKLQEALKGAQDKKAYVFSHQSIDPEVDKNHIVRNSQKIRQILEAHSNVQMVVQGHYHWGHETVINNIAYKTVSAMCEGENNVFEIIEID